MHNSVKVAIGIIASVTFCGVAIVLVFLTFDYQYPTQRESAAWEKNFKRGITSDIADFKGHWLDADIAAYIYSYRFTVSSLNEHKGQLIAALKEYVVIVNNDKELVMRQKVTYSHPEGYNEWRFFLNLDNKFVTVLYANLDSAAEMVHHGRLVALAENYHKMRPNKPPS